MQAKKTQPKSRFASKVSHELRTPLSIIRESIAQVLEGMHGKITKEQKKFLSLSIENIDRLNRAIIKLLKNYKTKGR